MRSERFEKDPSTALHAVAVRSLYMHFPFCRHLCNYCDFFKKVPTSIKEVREYETRLEEGYRVHAGLMRDKGAYWEDLDTVYVGGGTPSLWAEGGAEFLHRFFGQWGPRLSSDVEFTVEVNPGAHGPGVLETFGRAGVNRFSVGIQTLRPELLQALDRAHSVAQAIDTLEAMASLGVNYSVDFMLGLPGAQGKRDVVQELETVLGYGPSHLSVYILTTKSNYARANELPNEDWVAREYHEVSSFLRAKGYRHYEVSNFSLPGKESKHNMRYWRSETVAALGPSATGLFNAGGERACRYKWKANGTEYELETLCERDLRLEKLYLSLRTHEGLDYIAFWKTPENIQRFEELLDSWKLRALASSEAPRGHVALTPAGYLVMDGLLNEVFRTFDRI